MYIKDGTMYNAEIGKRRREVIDDTCVDTSTNVACYLDAELVRIIDDKIIDGSCN